MRLTIVVPNGVSGVGARLDEPVGAVAAADRLDRLVKRDGEARRRLLFEVAAELHGSEQGASLSELLGELDGEDLARVLYAIAVVKRRQSTSPRSPEDLWIRAAEPDQ